MLRVLIVDDEAAARRRLSALLEELDVDVVGEAADGLSALESIRRLRPDVVLLDIAMPEVDGFDVARHAADPKPLIVFQTAFDEYALQAFEHDAVDYVVKPVTRERLHRAIERAGRRLVASDRVPLTAEAIARAEMALGHARPARRSRVLVRHGAGHVTLPLRDVTHFVVADGLVTAITPSASFGTDYTLNELETRLAGAFIRTSRAELVNLDRIERIASNGDGSATLTVTGGTTIRVSRRRAADVRQALE
jgi:two-component system, LytTR family, response regulator